MTGVAARHRSPVAAVVLLGLLLGACAAPSPSNSGTSPSATGTSPRPSRPAASRPYDADAVLAAMTQSRRPGGVPDRIETSAVAAQVANAVWTYDGQPYPSLVIGGSCGATSCTLEVSGQPIGGAGADLFVFSVTQPAGAVTMTTTDLHGYPSGLDGQIEAVAREGTDADRLTGLAYRTASWQLPPRSGWFWAAFRSGGEEGSPGLDVLVDLPARAVMETRAP
jgi:hypothetical protein